VNAKLFLRTQTIPRLALADLDFPYFNLAQFRADLQSHQISIKPATLPRYLHDLVRSGCLFGAGRNWYSTLATPFVLDRAPVQDLAGVLESHFPLLDFSVWSTAQIASYGHHLLARFVTFVHAPKDAIESIAHILRDHPYTVFADPNSTEIRKDFRIGEGTVVIRPQISGSPVDGKFAAIEKIIVDLAVESALLNLMDVPEVQALTVNLCRSSRISIGTLARYAKNRRKVNLEALMGRTIN